MEVPKDIKKLFQELQSLLQQALEKDPEHQYFTEATKLVNKVYSDDSRIQELVSKIHQAGYKLSFVSRIDVIPKALSADIGTASIPKTTWTSKDNAFLKGLHISIDDEPPLPKE